MHLNDLLTKLGGGAKVVGGYISEVNRDQNNITVERYDSENSCGTTIPLSEIGIEELNLRKTSKRYLKKKKHPVIMFLTHELAIPSDIYDAVTGKPIHIEKRLRDKTC